VAWQTTTSAAQKYGITSFVYSRRRPFHPQRLMKVILQLPVKVDPDSGNLVDDWKLPGAAAEDGTKVGAAAAAKDSMEVESKGDAGPSVMRAVIRSKGFVWVANQHRSCPCLRSCPSCMYLAC
jgi:G3E family GTPase